MEEEWIDEECNEGRCRRQDYFDGNDGHISQYLTILCEIITKLDLSLDVIKTRLLADLSTLVLTSGIKPADYGRVRIFLESSFVISIIMNASTKTTDRQRLLLSLCFVSQKNIKYYLGNAYNSLHSGGDSVCVGGSCNDSEEQSFTKDTEIRKHDQDYLDRAIKSSVLIIKAFRRCLNWAVCGMHGEAGQLAYVDLTRLLVCIFLFRSEVAARIPVTLSSLLSHLDEVVMYQMKEPFPSRATRHEMLMLLAEFSVRLSASGPHFELAKANDVIVSLIRNDLLLEKTKDLCKRQLETQVWDPYAPPIVSCASQDMAANMLKAFKVIDTLCHHHMHLLDDIHNIFQLMNNLKELSIDTCVLGRRENNVQIDYFDIEADAPLKTVLTPVVVEQFTLVRRKVCAVRKRCGKEQTSMDPLTDMGAFSSSASCSSSLTKISPSHVSDVSVADVFRDLTYNAHREEQVQVNQEIIDVLAHQPDFMTALLTGIESSGECTTDFGAYSDLQYCLSLPPPFKLSTVDTVTLVEDAVYSHLQCSMYRETELEELYDTSSVYLDDSIQWKTLSGSCDPLMVLTLL